MGDEKIKIGDIEGTQEDVVKFFRESGLDIADYINTAKIIKVPLYTIIVASVLFFITACTVAILGESYPKIKTILTLLSVAFAFLNICLVYMCWKNKTIAGIIALAEIIIFSLALSIYTPKDIVNKIEEKINTDSNKEKPD